MNSSGKFSYLFRKYPLLRVVGIGSIVALIIFSIYFISFQTKLIPEIESIVPPVGSPGDVILINGKNFGNNRDMNYVEIAGTRLTASSYISWTDTCIKLVLPANVKDGLVYVGIKDIRSNPSLFANEVDIPIPVPSVHHVSRPIITSLSADKANIGDVLTIYGSNFGEARNQSRVLFTIDYNRKIRESNVKNISYFTENMIGANEDEFDYIMWSNTEISVVIPDGAFSGVVVVDTGKQKSDPKEITINQNSGEKSFVNKKIYLMTYSADVADVYCDGLSTITLRAPIPYETAAQPNVETTEVVPLPSLMKYQHDVIHQITKNRTSTVKNVMNYTFVLPVYEINTKVNADKIGLYTKMASRTLFNYTTQADALIPADDEAVKALEKQITGREKNPYRKAKLIYDYMLKNYGLLKKMRKGGADPLDLLSKKRGDAYDFAVIYAALLRAGGIPCFMDAGILIGQDLTTQAHWWNEFYIENFGWVPVDISLAAGLEYKAWGDFEVPPAEYYFGNLDSHHVLFSRGLNDLKPFSVDNKIVKQPRSFALQSIWEEASSNVNKYSSYWSTPVVRGVY